MCWTLCNAALQPRRQTALLEWCASQLRNGNFPHEMLLVPFGVSFCRYPLFVDSVCGFLIFMAKEMHHTLHPPPQNLCAFCLQFSCSLVWGPCSSSCARPRSLSLLVLLLIVVGFACGSLCPKCGTPRRNTAEPCTRIAEPFAHATFASRVSSQYLEKKKKLRARPTRNLKDRVGCWYQLPALTHGNSHRQEDLPAHCWVFFWMVGV